MPLNIDHAFKFYFVRHGATDFNVRGVRCGGDIDMPMVELGREQAYRVGSRLAKLALGVDQIVAASLLRARETALIVSGVLGGLPVETEPLLNERRLGAWNGTPIAENEHLLQRGDTPPGGESEVELTDRITLAVEKLRVHFSRRLLIVSSRGVGRVLHKLLGGEGRLGVENGEIVEFSGVGDTAGGNALHVHRLR